MTKYTCSRYLLVTITLLSVFFACRKSEDVRFKTPLAIDSRIVRVNSTADTTRIIVYAEGDWQLEPSAETPWLHLLSGNGHGKSDALVSVDDNSTALPRAAALVVKSNGRTDTIQLQQKGIVPALTITDTTAQVIANGGNFKTPLTTNIPLELMTVNYQYDAAASNWVSGLKVKDGYLYFTADTSHLAVERSTVLTLSYLDALGTTTKDSIRIRQKQGISYEGAVLKDFSYVKQLLAAGAITENIYIEGTVISDKGHPNIAENYNTPANKHVLDKTENSIAVYVQSTDGTSGLYFKTKTAGDNILNFNDRVKIWLKGATLQKLTAPDRTVITGIDVTNIMQKNVGTTTLVPREKYMAELTDNDLYTYLKLKEVELSVPGGAFTNINEGYTARMDCYPASIRDIQGSSMYMLTNLDVPYRRDGNPAPQGSGSITGILVHEEFARYGGNIGRYSIRHLKREDIALAQDRSNGFSKVLAEWSRFKQDYAATPTEALNPLTPDIGSGRLYQSAKKPLDFTANGIFTTTDYNGLLQEPTTVKGAITNGAWGAKGWWNTAANTGEYWGIEVSTAGITTPLSLQVEGNTDPGGPRNFVVEWSSDNSSWSQAGSFTFQDVANWTSTLLTQVAGYKVVNIPLPAGASGLDKLYIRLRVANKTTGSSTSDSGGTFTATTSCRLAHLSLKYNK